MKNRTNLKLHDRSSRVKETKLPSVKLPFTVGVRLFRQATYNAHASQCNFSPYHRKTEEIEKIKKSSRVCVDNRLFERREARQTHLECVIVSNAMKGGKRLICRALVHVQVGTDVLVLAGQSFHLRGRSGAHRCSVCVKC